MKKPLIGISGNTLRDTSGAYVDLIRSYVNQIMSAPSKKRAVFLLLFLLQKI